MSASKIMTISTLAFLTLNPLGALAQEKPIILVTSNSKNPPLAGNNHRSVGYWDVDDYDGNGGGRSWTKIFPPYKFDGSIRTASQGTCGGAGHYMATLTINQNSIGQITNLRIIATSGWQALASYSHNVYGNCRVWEDNSRNNYVVGWWDVDGGGGVGSDGSSGSRAMALVAEYGVSSSDRRLLDIQLVASSKKTPTFISGYQMVGFWDVDKGGSRGTDGSSGHYMMTLLAKWDR